MARQEATNIFSDGLMSDLHPINTPKSVLTDCLNGTYVTYNGNEFILQNDMGNYKLQNCKLPVNFIPVGVKGYADILYIVSYNPITKQVEIGSYPSPQTIQAAGDSASKLLEYYDWTGTETYPQLSSKDKPLVLFVEDDEEAVKMYPGDEFYLETEPGDDLTPKYIYQHLDYYIVDEDKKLYDLDDADFESRVKDENNFSKVFWETPGWLAAKWRLYVPDRFNLNVRSLNVPEFLLIDKDETGTDTQAEESTGLRDQEAEPGKFKVSLDLSSQTIIMDTLFQKTLNDNDSDNDNDNVYNNDPISFNHLFIRYLIRTSSTTETDREWGTVMGVLDSNKTTPEPESESIGEYKVYDIPCYRHNYQDDIITAYNNVYIAWSFAIPQSNGEIDLTNFNGSVEVTAFPIIKMEGISTLEFRQFETTQRFDLDNIKDSRDIKIADSTYKWSVDDDSCTLSFNINGPFVNASNITGRYEIYRLNMFDNKIAAWEDDPNHEGQQRPKWEAKTSKSTWNNVTLTQNTDRFGYLEKITDPNIKNRTFVELNGIDKNSSQLGMSNGKPGNLLMLSGDIPNIVLYGQNTINIGWENSNVIKFTDYKNWYSQDQKYETLTPSIPNISIGGSIGTLPVGGIIGGGNSNVSTTLPGISLKPLEQEMILDENNTSKTIRFEKEGGLYVFRVIIEQDGKSIAKQDSLLIPSEVFNEFFGSVDNYNNITGDTWINKYVDLISYDGINLQNLSIELNPNEDDKFLEYKWASDNDWSLLDTKTIRDTIKIWRSEDYSLRDFVDAKLESGKELTTNQCLGFLYWAKDRNFLTYTINESSSKEEEQLVFGWKEYTKSTNIENLQIRYNYNLIKDKTITWNSNQTLAKVLHGNLWNPVIETTANLKSGTTDTGLQITDDGYKSKFNFESLATVQNLNIDQEKWDGYIKKSTYPFLDNIIKGYTFGMEYSINPWTTKTNYETQYKTFLYQLKTASESYADHLENAQASSEDDNWHSMGNSDIQMTFSDFMGNRAEFILGCIFFFYYRANTSRTQAHQGESGIGCGTDGDHTDTFLNYILRDHPDGNNAVHITRRINNLLFVRYFTGNKTYVVALDIPWEKICNLCRIRLDVNDQKATFYYPLFLDWQDVFSLALNYNINTCQVTTNILHLRIDDYIWKTTTSNNNLLKLNSIISTKQRNSLRIPSYLLTVDLNKNIFINVGTIISDWIKSNQDDYKKIEDARQSNEFLFIEEDQTRFQQYVESHYASYIDGDGWFYVLWNTEKEYEDSNYSGVRREAVYLPWASNYNHGSLDLIWDLKDISSIIDNVKNWFGGTQDKWTGAHIYYQQPVGSRAVKSFTRNGEGDSGVNKNVLSYCYYIDTNL